MSAKYDKNGIKIIQPQKYKAVKTCWKRSYTEDEAKYKASMAFDDRGGYEAYQCPNDSSHWHIGHHPLFEVRKAQV